MHKSFFKNLMFLVAACPLACLAEDYTYTVPFEGDFDAAHQVAFSHLIKDISSGSVNSSGVKTDINSLIVSENITDDGLEITFSEEGVKKLLNSGAVPVWKGLAEPIVLWIVAGSDSDDGKVQAHFVTDEKNSVVVALENAGKDANISFLMPMFDLDDIGALSVSDTMLGDTVKTSLASGRYAQGLAFDGIIMKGDNGNISLSYHLIGIDTKESIIQNSYSGTPEDIAAAFINDLKTHASNLKSYEHAHSKIDNSTQGQSGADSVSSDVLSQLGMQQDGTVQILVYGNAYSDYKDAREELLKSGFVTADIGDVGKNYAIIKLGFSGEKQFADLIANCTALKASTANYSYNFMGIQSSNSTEEEGVPAGNFTFDENQNNSDIPDPNQKLHTGGGVIR